MARKAYYGKGDERRISRVRRLLIISCFILGLESILEDLQEILLHGELRKIGGNAVVCDEGIGKVSNCPDIF
jgi:hypothetical protein